MTFYVDCDAIDRIHFDFKPTNSDLQSNSATLTGRFGRSAGIPNIEVIHSDIMQLGTGVVSRVEWMK